MTETATGPSAAGPSSIAVLTSGGDAGGMNPAIRAVVRTAVHHGIDVYAVADGYRGLIQGGDAIRRVESADVGGILQLGGTILGTARSMEFREREGRRRAARNLLEVGVDALVVIGGDGSLTGADLLRQEWPELVPELCLVEVRGLEPHGVVSTASPGERHCSRCSH
jgi:6-phosphofructokinase 1